MKFTVTEKVFEKFPDAKFGALLVQGVDNTKHSNELKILLKETVTEVAQKFSGKDLKDIPQIRSWREAFKTLKLNRDFLPSHEALLRRVVTKKELPSINPLVDIYNIVSLKNLIPIGGHDVDKAGDIRIDETTGEENFLKMNSTEKEVVNAGELAYLSGKSILTRHFVWRQSETSKTDENTKTVFIPIDDAAGDMTEEKIMGIADELSRLLEKNLGGKSQFKIVTKGNPEASFDTDKNIKASSTSKPKGIDPRWKKYQDIVELKKPKMDVVTDEKLVNEALTRGIKATFPDDGNLKKRMMAGERLTLYTGIDPTADFLHVGHFIWMRKLAQFQRLGHRVIFLIGAFTAMIGDPDKQETREPLTKEKVWDNFSSYKTTAAKLLDFEWEENPITILNNFDWLSKVALEDWLQIMGSVTMQHILSHDMFKQRIEQEKPIRLHETMYPLMQGFDSVAMNVDLEVGGSDQTFNMLTGRILEREILGKEKFILTMKLLTDPTGAKMGKTTGNAIASTDSPEDMFGKVMSWPDESMFSAFELLTDVDLKKAEDDIKKDPMSQKKLLAREIVTMLNNEESAKKAQEHFEKTVQGGETPDEMKELEYNGKHIALELAKFLVEKGIINSNADAKRLIQQGGMEIDGKKVTKQNEEIELNKDTVVKVGKRKFVRIK